MGPTKRRKCVIGGVARSYRDDGLIRGDFQGESTAQGCPADKEVNACASAQESKDVRSGRGVVENHVFKSAILARSARALDSGASRDQVLNARLASSRLALPRRAALIPSYLGTYHATGCLFSLPSSPSLYLFFSSSLRYSFLFLVSPRRRGGATSFNISRRLSSSRARRLSSSFVAPLGSPLDLFSSSRAPTSSARALSR